MPDSNLNLMGSGQTLQLELLAHLRDKPAPFSPGETLFWDDPYISGQMLATHLDPTVDLASRRPETIDRAVTWLIETLGLPKGAKVLDLGCGPGLYASRLARHGLAVTGVDYSQRSINYATQYAREQQLAITYRYENYLELNDEGIYDAALLIFGDFCPLNPDQRARLLHNVHRALKPGGRFILDVSTGLHHQRYNSGNGWRVDNNGFWRAGVCLVLDDSFDYPEQNIFLNQAVVIDALGRLSVYRMWFQDYTPRSITEELATSGFAVESIWSDLCGQAYVQDSEWIGVVAQKVLPVE
jgi:SAM-dependent methyltransferase